MNKDLSTDYSLFSMHNIYQNVLNKLLNRIFIDGNNSRSLVLIGFCYKKLGYTNKAIKFFEKAIISDKHNFSAYFQMGLCALNINKNCVALNSFIKAIQVNSENIHAVLNLAIAHENCEEDDMALMIYQRLIETSPACYKAYVFKANLYIKKTRYSDAIELLLTALKINPYSAEIFSLLGYCHRILGKQSDAYKFYRKVLDINTSDSNYRETIKILREIRFNGENKRCVANLKICV